MPLLEVCVATSPTYALPRQYQSLEITGIVSKIHCDHRLVGSTDHSSYLCQEMSTGCRERTQRGAGQFTSFSPPPAFFSLFIDASTEFPGLALLESSSTV